LTEHPIGIRLAVKKTAGNEIIGDINERRREHMKTKTLLGGAVAAAFGLIGLVIWWEEFFEVLAGIIPVMLLLGGGLAIYLGFDELKDSLKEEKSFGADDIEESTGGNVEKYKQEIDDLKEEIETLKKEKDEEGEKKEEKKDKAQKEEK
jgi:hypothetical protein